MNNFNLKQTFRITNILLYAVILALTLTSCSATKSVIVDRSTPPELGAPPAFTTPKIAHLELSNGLPVTLIE